jgi:hypothetical protein
MSKTPLIVVLLIFIGFFFFPYFYNTATAGLGAKLPELQQPKGDQCVESKEWMSENHMVLLKEWRDSVIRKGIRQYTSDTYGTTYNISIKTCFECHTSKVEFCDKCHAYAGVKPNCWSCHTSPELWENYGTK